MLSDALLEGPALAAITPGLQCKVTIDVVKYGRRHLPAAASATCRGHVLCQARVGANVRKHLLVSWPLCMQHSSIRQAIALDAALCSCLRPTAAAVIVAVAAKAPCVWLSLRPLN